MVFFGLSKIGRNLATLVLSWDHGEDKVLSDRIVMFRRAKLASGRFHNYMLSFTITFYHLRCFNKSIRVQLYQQFCFV